MITVTNERTSLDSSILRSLTKANIFYSEEFFKYSSKRFDTLYLYNEDFIQIVQVNTIRSVFHQASYPSEPFMLGTLNDFQSQQTFLDKCSDYLKKEYKVDWILATSPTLLFKSFPSKSKRIPFGNFVIDLTLSEEDIFNNFSNGHRRDCKKAEKDGVVVKFGHKELLAEYLSIDNELWARNGQQKDNETRYSTLVDGLPNNTLIGLAYKDNALQCGRLGFFNEAMFYCMYSATKNNHARGSANLLHYEFMKELKQRGVKSYNFVGCRINVDPGTKPANIQFFKQRFGGKLEYCYLFKEICSPLKKMLFDFLLRILGRKESDILDQEIHKWSELNKYNKPYEIPEKEEKGDLS